MAKNSRKHNHTNHTNHSISQINSEDATAVREDRVKSRRAKRLEDRKNRDKREHVSGHPLREMKHQIAKRTRVHTHASLHSKLAHLPSPKNERVPQFEIDIYSLFDDTAWDDLVCMGELDYQL